MTNCVECGRWGILNSDYREVFMFETEYGPICEMCIEDIIKRKKLECQREIADLELLKLKRGGD